MASKVQALSLVGREGPEADALDFASDFELDLWLVLSARLFNSRPWIQEDTLSVTCWWCLL